VVWIQVNLKMNKPELMHWPLLKMKLKMEMPPMDLALMKLKEENKPKVCRN
jgi:hypothetical protein